MFSCNDLNTDYVKSFRNWEPFEISEDAASISRLFMPSNFHRSFKGFQNKTYFYTNNSNTQISYTIGDCELDALTHFYANLLYKEKYGIIITGFAGLINELYGSIVLGNKWKSQKIDFQNNYSGLINSNKRQLKILKMLLNKEEINDSTLKEFLVYGLKHTKIPPKTQRNWRPWR